MSRWFYSALAVIALFAGNAMAQPASVRLGVFDPEEVWKLTEVGKKYNQELTNHASRLQDGIEKKQQEIEAIMDKLRQQQASLSDSKIQQMQRDVQNKRIDLERMNSDAKREMNEQLNEVQGRFQMMLIEVIDALGSEKKYTLILSNEVVGYTSPNADITPQVIAKFNEMHKVPSSSGSP